LECMEFACFAGEMGSAEDSCVKEISNLVVKAYEKYNDLRGMVSMY